MNITIKNYEKQYWKDICTIHDAARKVELKYASLEDAFLPLAAAADKEDGPSDSAHVFSSFGHTFPK